MLTVQQGVSPAPLGSVQGGTEWLQYHRDTWPARATSSFGTLPLPKEIQGPFLTPFKPAWVRLGMLQLLQLHQRDVLHPRAAASPTVGTTNPALVTVLSRQRKLNLKAKTTGKSIFFPMFCLSLR